MLAQTCSLVSFAVEVVYQPYFAVYRVQSRIGVSGVSVREVAASGSQREVEQGGDCPIQIKVGVEIGVDTRTYHLVVGIACLVVRLPTPRNTEIPLVVE